MSSGSCRRFAESDNSDTESESETSTDDLTARESLTEGAMEAKFLCSLFARFRTATTRGLRIPAACIRRDTFAYPDGAEPINDSQ
jgi:hypothetical protein